MSKSLKDAIDVIERLPPDQQLQAAALLRSFVAEVEHDAEGLAVARDSLEAARRGELDSDDQVDALRKPWR